jgi:hypothetical protein
MESPVVAMRAKREHEDDPERDVQQLLPEGLLYPSVAGPEHFGDAECDATNGEATDGRSCPPGDRKSIENLGQAVEALGVQQTDEPAEDPDQGEPDELGDIRQSVVLDVSEQWAEALEGGKDGVADDGSDEGGKERLDLEVVPVHDLGGEHRTAKGSTKNRADTRTDPARDGDAGVRWAEVEEAGEKGTEPRTDLARRPLSPPGTTRADGEGRGDDLDKDRSETDAARVVVYRIDSGVSTVPSGVRSNPEDEDPARQRSEACDEGDGPGSAEVRRSSATAFADRRGNAVAGDHPEEQMGGFAEGLVEDDGAKSGDDADESAEHEPFATV